MATRHLNVQPCRTCGHVHPAGVGTAYCGCDDCDLLWSSRPDLLAPEYRQRRDWLRGGEGDG